MTRAARKPIVEYKRPRGVHISEGSMTRTYRMTSTEDIDEVLDKVFGENAVLTNKNEGNTLGYIIKPDGGWCRVRDAS